MIWKKFGIGVIAITVAVGLWLWAIGGSPQYPNVKYDPAPAGMAVIAHAGGGIPEGKYSNALQAFDHSAQAGFQYIEADFSLAENGDIVLIHGWGLRYHQYFSPLDRMPHEWKKKLEFQAKSAEDFKQKKMKYGLRQMDFEDFLNWMDDNPGPSIVTDAKDENIRVLSEIAMRRPDLKRRIIPQIYHSSEYEPIKALGYEHIIYTAYRGELTPEGLIAFAQQRELFALTVPVEELTLFLAEQTEALGLPLWVHRMSRTTPVGLTNTADGARTLMGRGVDGIYTDFLVPATAE